MAKADDEQKGVGEVVSDLWQLCRDYAKQETIDPLKALGRFLKFGVPGGLLLGIGISFLSLAVVRALQTEVGAFDGNGIGSVAPYGIALLVAIVTVGASVAAIKRPMPGERKGS